MLFSSGYIVRGRMTPRALSWQWRIRQRSGNFRHGSAGSRRRRGKWPGDLMKLGILALEGCMHFAISGIADILSLSNYVMKLRGSSARFSWQILSLNGKAVRAGGGQLLQVDGVFSNKLACDAIIMPGSLIDHVTAQRLAPQYKKG